MPDPNAAPYCDAELYWRTSGDKEKFLTWRCRNPGALIGRIDVDMSGCFPYIEEGTGWGACTLFPSTEYKYHGEVYNERPAPGEQGRMMVMFFATAWQVKADLIVKVRDSDQGVTTGSDNTPDIGMLNKRPIGGGDEDIKDESLPGQLNTMRLKLNGSVGADTGHPLMTNPTFCDEQWVRGEFQGYARNSIDPPSEFPVAHDYTTWTLINGSGDGFKHVADPIPYTATNCEAIRYAPTFAASASTDAPGAAPELSTVITQAEGEATTKQIHVEFPKGMGININSTLKPCSAADLAAKSCPEVSKMGTVEVESRLLPKAEFLGDDIAPEDEVLKGEVFLTGREGNKLTLATLLSGFIDLQVNARAGVEPDGTVTATFEDMPSMPFSKLALNLFGGNKGLLANPRKCGPATATATFTSHSGKTHTVQSTSQIKGCSGPPSPEFEIDLSNNGKGKRTTVELDISAQERHIKKVTFGLPRYLKFSTKRLGKAKRFGSLAIETERGELETSLSLSQSVRAKRKKKKAIRFSSKGALNDLKVSLFKRKVGTKKVRIRTKSGKKKTVKRSVLKSRMSLKSLPKQDIKGMRVELNPSESRFLRNPKGCKKPLRFLAFVTTSDGKRHVLSQKVKLKGKGCTKKKKKK